MYSTTCTVCLEGLEYIHVCWGWGLGKRLWGVGGGHDLCLFPLLVLKSAQAILSDVANTSDPLVDM